jgi:flagellar protein FliO/FliZ
MASLSSILTFVAILAFLLALAAAGIYLFKTAYPEKAARFFAPRVHRLAFIERTRLDGGRKLLLVRRDDVEHLILIGGPIDLIVETGIRPEIAGDATAREESYEKAERSPEALPAAWETREFPLTARHGLPLSASLDLLPVAAKSGVDNEPRLSLSPKKVDGGEDMLELTAVHETKPL